MSIIGDALNRAEEDSRPGRAGSEHVPAAPAGRRLAYSTVVNTDTRPAEVKPPVAETLMSSAKGIAHPRPSAAIKRQKESPVFGMVLLSLLGLAGYMIVYPGWIDSLWNFESPKTLAASRPPATVKQSTRTTSDSPRADFIPTPIMQAAPSSGSGPLAEGKPSADSESKIDLPHPGPERKRERSTRPVPRSISRLPIHEEARRSRFQVDGVMLGGRRTLAVVNGAIVGVGDEVDGAIVRAIVDHAVALEIDGRIRRIPLRAPKPESDQDQASRE